IPYLAGAGDYRPVGTDGFTVKLSKEDAIIGKPISYKVSGVSNLTAGNAEESISYTVKAPMIAGYTLWEDVASSQTIEVFAEGGDFIVYFPYYLSGALVDDSVIYDESAPVEFDVLKNDAQPDGESFTAIYGIGVDKNIFKGDTVVETKYGKLEITRSGKVRYTAYGIRSVTEVFYYAVQDGFGNIRIGTIYIAPATIVKTDVASAIIDAGDGWHLIDNDKNVVNGDPEQYIVDKNTNDADDIYGDDDYSYSGAFKFNAGYALYANRYQDYVMSGGVDGTDAYYTTTFSFDGTGFDIISVTGRAGGYIYITTTDINGKVVEKASGSVLTYSNNDDIYQATVFTCTDLELGRYTVEVTALKTYIPRIGMTDTQVYIDSVRTYNPFADNRNEHYNDIHDGTVTSSLRDIFADGKLAIGELGEGMFTLSGALDINDFVSKGTNNAINISGGQSLLFSLENASAHTTFQVEMSSFQYDSIVYVIVNNDVVEKITLDSAIFAYYDFSKYIREDSTVKFEVIEGNVTFAKVRYKNAELGVPSEGDKYETGDFVQNGTAPEVEWMSEEYRINSVHITHNKKEGTRTVTAIVYTSANADTV
ncbi:MAG: hypothetical protein IKY44_02910, partial [Clostridia bacterium]|nr:hypothetical protein [Clostridia bacterium]